MSARRFVVVATLAVALACQKAPPSVSVVPEATVADAAVESSASVDAATAAAASDAAIDGAVVHVPKWDTGDVPARLSALAVRSDNWAQRDLVSWTTPAQVDALRASHVLLVATANAGGPPSPFVYLLENESKKKGPAADLAKRLWTESRFSRRRYAWTVGYATVLGLLQKRYGEELVGIRLRADAWVVELDPSRNPAMRVRDLAQNEVALDEAVRHAERIGAVYHVRTGKDVPRPFREYVVVNESAVERWAVGTPDVVAEVDAETKLLRELRALLDADGGAAPPALEEAWRGTLAFDNDRYGKLDVKHVDLVLEGLSSYDRKQAALEGTPPK